MIDLPFVRSKAGSWRIRLTHDLMAPETRRPATGHSNRDPVQAEEERKKKEEEEVQQEAPYVEKFPEKLAESLGTIREKTAREAAEQLLVALRSPSLVPACSRMDLHTTPATALNALGRAGRLWQRIHLPFAEASPVLLEVHEAGDDAWALVQLFSARDSGDPSIECLFFKRDPEGWLANPGFSGESALPYTTDELAVSTLLEPALAARDAEWWSGLIQKIGGVAADSAPSEEEARKIVEESRNAVASGDPLRYFSLSVCLDDDRGPLDMLKACSNDLTGRQAGEILAIHRAGRWAAASLRVPPMEGDDSADSYPMVVLVATPEGPKILPEINLFDPLTENRGLRNRAVLERVGTRLPEGARAELEGIYEKHRTISAADRGSKKPKE